MEKSGRCQIHLCWTKTRWTGALLALTLAAGGLVACGGPVDDGLELSSTTIEQSSLPLVGRTRGAGTPLSVPDDYVVTPAGYVHHSCVTELAEGERVFDDRIHRPDGTLRKVVSFCAQEAYDREGHIRPRLAGAVREPAGDVQPRGEQASVVPGLTNWAEYADNSWAGYAVTSQYAEFTVPLAPTSQGNQIVYLFPGAVGTAGSIRVIMQPVLRYQAGAWTIASYVVNSNGLAILKSNEVPVTPGTRIVGELSGSSCVNHTCATWTLKTAVCCGDNLPATTIVYNNTQQIRFEEVYGAALEIYNVTACNQLPASGVTSFFGQFDRNGVTVFSPTWSPHVPTPFVSPSCSYNPTASATNWAHMSWWAGYQPYDVTFDNGTNWPRNVSPYDWSNGQFKGQCGMADAVAGMSAHPSSARAHSLLCRYSGRVGRGVNIIDFSNTSVIYSPDWDYGYYKGECPSNQVLAGVSQSTNGRLTKILCKELTGGGYGSGPCTTRVYSNQNSQGANSAGDWAYGYYKGECAVGEVVKGVSRNASTGQAHAILCCPLAL